MQNKSKIMLRKLSNLLKIHDSFNDRHWPANVLDTLETKYQLSPQEMLRLWYMRCRISNGKHPVDSLLIYDRVGASEKRISVRNSWDLHINSDLLRFKGNIFGNGSIQVERLNN